MVVSAAGLLTLMSTVAQAQITHAIKDVNTPPNRAGLIFDCYGNDQFLSKIYAPGKAMGAAVIELT